MKRNDKRGFTLAEMLIVVAIISVLVATLAVTISSAMEKAREAVDLATIKTAQEELYTYVIDNSIAKKSKPSYMFYTKADNNGSYYAVCVKMTQKKAGWQSNVDKDSKGYAIVGEAHIDVNGAGNNYYYKVMFFPEIQPVGKATNTEPYNFRVDRCPTSEAISKSRKWYQTNELVSY